MILNKCKIILSGDNFNPEEFIKLIDNKANIVDSFKKGDTIGLKLKSIADYGQITVENIIPYGYSYDQGVYEEWYNLFLSKYYNSILKKDILFKTFSISLYFQDGYECGYEIENNHLLRQLAKLNFRLSISAYNLDEGCFNKMLSDNGLKL